MRRPDRHQRITAMRALELLRQVTAAEALARRDEHHGAANVLGRVGDELAHHVQAELVRRRRRHA